MERPVSILCYLRAAARSAMDSACAAVEEWQLWNYAKMEGPSLYATPHHIISFLVPRSICENVHLLRACIPVLLWGGLAGLASLFPLQNYLLESLAMDWRKEFFKSFSHSDKKACSSYVGRSTCWVERRMDRVRPSLIRLVMIYSEKGVNICIDYTYAYTCSSSLISFRFPLLSQQGKADKQHSNLCPFISICPLNIRQIEGSNSSSDPHFGFLPPFLSRELL